MSTQYTFSDDLKNQYNLPSHLIPPGAKTQLSVFTFPLDGITDAGRAILKYAKENPWRCGISAALITGGFLFLTVPTLVGFAETGPVSGSLAAAWQSWLGNVVAGSLFACIQSFAMTGVFDTIGAAMAASGAVGLVPVPLPSRGGRSFQGGALIPAMAPAAVLAAYYGYMGI